MKAGQMISSKFLKKDDVDPAKLVTIKGISQANVAQEDQPEELKWTMHFKELDKPLVMNSTNIQLCTLALGSDETNDWIGKQIVLYNDPSVSFAGKITGGVRIRKPKNQVSQAANAAPAADPAAFEDDDIPF